MNTAAPTTHDANTDAAPLARPAPSARQARSGDTALRRISMAACLALVAACGGEDEPVAWKDMSFEERSEFMTDIVLPRMTEVFVEYDAKYENMTCETCHGSDAVARGYAMPTPQIAPLPATPEGFLEWVADPAHPEREAFGTFMYERVVPEMAALLEIPRFDPMTETGDFSCHYCHTLEEVKP
ncbi:hypothetical protein [Sorangium sp. So ce406]|uniref:hypothetical protein n=1 Tax=Sorangium sp. So ce406 TaxID=3133311 RepID=UPI003F5C9314